MLLLVLAASFTMYITAVSATCVCVCVCVYHIFPKFENIICVSWGGWVVFTPVNVFNKPAAGITVTQL